LAPFATRSRSLQNAADRPAAALFLPAIAVDKPASSGSVTPQQVRSTSSKPATPVVRTTTSVKLAPVQYNNPQVETATSIQLKYAVLLDTEVEQLPSASLLEQIDPWMGVPYRSGGSSRSGIDCSAFTMQVFEQCCGWKLPRTSRQQHAYCEPTRVDTLSSGDLLFYATRGKGVSHVGIYLGNGKFAHASVSNGVTVSDMADPYYQKRFVSAGRIPAVASQK
jgi:cell wall-associated NlpC family hydrolase